MHTEQLRVAPKLLAAASNVCTSPCVQRGSEVHLAGQEATQRFSTHDHTACAWWPAGQRGHVAP